MRSQSAVGVSALLAVAAPNFNLVTSTTTTLAFAPLQSLSSFSTSARLVQRDSSITHLYLTPDSSPPSPQPLSSQSSSSVSTLNKGSHEELMYALGVNLARQLGDVRALVDTSDELTLVARGLLDALVGRLDEEGQRELLTERTADLNSLVTDRAQKIQKKLEQAGRRMLQTMSQTEGAQTFQPSGVCLHVLEYGPEGEGRGVRPTASSTVKVHYHGTLPDGTVFDSTILGGGDPARFAMAQVIPGWREGLLKMHEGETAMIGIPPEFGYGPKGSGDGRIPGGATIFFKVQLLEVLTAGIGGTPTLLGSDGKKLGSGARRRGSAASGGGLLGADGRPL